MGARRAQVLHPAWFCTRAPAGKRSSSWPKVALSETCCSLVAALPRLGATGISPTPCEINYCCIRAPPPPPQTGPMRTCPAFSATCSATWPAPPSSMPAARPARIAAACAERGRWRRRSRFTGDGGESSSVWGLLCRAVVVPAVVALFAPDGLTAVPSCQAPHAGRVSQAQKHSTFGCHPGRLSPPHLQALPTGQGLGRHVRHLSQALACRAQFGGEGTRMKRAPSPRQRMLPGSG